MRIAILFLALSFASCTSLLQRTEEAPAAPAKKRTIIPSATSSENDFDFLVGKWKVQNRMLKSRITNSNEWIEFDSDLHMSKALLGRSNVEHYYSTWNGKPFEGMAIRLYDRDTRLWSVYWVDSNGGGMDGTPVTGSFENGVGKLYADDVFEGRPIVILYQWDATDPEHPVWSQAVSTDDGATWEWNWYMRLTKLY